MGEVVINQEFRVQPTLVTLISICALASACGNLVWGVIAALAAWYSGSVTAGIVALVLSPLVGAAHGALTALLGYPLFRLWCSKVGAPRVEGIFTPFHFRFQAAERNDL